ncbi:MAG: DUF4093 domain-containing protein [Clostridia bacterium]|nr:DUF4093 domain-containing protein [Clostridia bacterium]
MRRVRQAIVVEGKYDVIRVQSAVEAIVIPTNGFRIFKDRERVAMLRRLAAVRGLILLTDSDSAGTLIRNHLIGCIPAEQIRQAFVPPRPGKERRKAAPSKEGLLGVEGIDNATIIAALERAGAIFEDETTPSAPSLSLTKTDLMEAGLSGTPDAAAKRQKLLEMLELPPSLSANRLLEVVNATATRDEWAEWLKMLE